MVVIRPVSALLLGHLHRRRFSASISPETPLQRSVRICIENRDYLEILPLLLLLSDSSTTPKFNPNPFSFLSLLPPPLTTRIIDDLLQSFKPLRPRSLPYPIYSSLLSLTLPSPSNPSSVLFPHSLAVLQSTILSGLPPPSFTRLSLSLSWLHLRRIRNKSVPVILSSVSLLGYRHDLNTLNYLISSLCAASEVEEAVEVLRSMAAVGIGPDSESYCIVIEAMKGAEAEEMLREMVGRIGLMPRKGMVGRVVGRMRKEGEVRRAAELLRFLQREGCSVGFEGYENVVEGCLEMGEIVLAAKVVAEMAESGFIPYVWVRQRVVEGLVGIGQGELGCALRQRLAEIGSYGPRAL